MVPISLSRKTPRHNQQTNVRSQFRHSVLRFPQLLQQHCGHRFSYCSKGRWLHTGLSLSRSFCLTKTLKYQSQSPLLKPPWTLSHAPWAAQGPKPRSPAHTAPCSLLIPTHVPSKELKHKFTCSETPLLMGNSDEMHLVATLLNLTSNYGLLTS